MKTDTAVSFIKSITNAEIERYTRYLGGIIPVSNEDLFRRWMFAYASVHTTWKLNCKMYQALATLDWRGDYAELLTRIKESGAGLHNNRARYIFEFSSFFWDHPAWFWKNQHEGWAEYRDRIQEVTAGIGRAKSSFVTEMAYPKTAEVICTDTHVMQLYGSKRDSIGAGRVSDKDEKAMETHWVAECKASSVAPALARWIFWDRKQGYSDSRYWSFVFEPENVHNMFRAKALTINTL